MRNPLEAVRYSLRQFRLSPVFTTSAVLTLALGIGGTTAIGALIHAVMLKSLPVADPALLYRIGDGDDCCVQGGPQDRWGMYSFPLYERLIAATPEFETVTAFQAGWNRMGVRREGSPGAARPLRSEYVTGSYFSTLGVQAFGGRVFSPGDDKPSASPVAVLSHHAWQAAYGADPSVVGATFLIEGRPFTVIGVTPPGFFGETLGADPPDIWIPLHQEPVIAGDRTLLNQPVAAWLRAIGRLRAGATTAGMAPRLTGILRGWLQHDSGYPSNWMPEVMHDLPKQVIEVVPAGAGVAVMKEQYSHSLQILLGVCVMVLLIACCNVANLLLARAAARRQQTALRLAIGAGRRQIIVQALAESVLLSVGGCLAGLGVAAAATRLLLRLAFSNARFMPIGILPPPIVLGFALLGAILTGIVFGAVPAWFAIRTDPAEALRGSGRGTTDNSGFVRKALLVGQAALSVVLVAGATMLAHSLGKLENQNFGYLTKGRIFVSVNSPSNTYTVPQLTALYRRIEEGMNGVPGVRGLGLALYNPLTNNWGEGVLVSGHPLPRVGEDSGASWDRVSADYLQNLGISVSRGRNFTRADNETAAPVAIVNQAFVKRFFKTGEDPLDQHFGLDLPQNDRTFRIVGIVRDAKFAGWGLTRPAMPMFYVPLAQNVDYKDDIMTRVELASHFIGGLLLVTDLPPGAIEPQVTRVLAGVDPNLTINSVRTIQEQIALTFNQDRALASLAGLFGAVALLLAAVGLYGVTAYTVTQRTNEIGIRMALGASRADVVRHVLFGAFARVAIGLGFGLPLAVGAGRLIASKLYDVSYWDPLALAVAIGSLGFCALIAALAPAAVAASISPSTALRVA